MKKNIILLSTISLLATSFLGGCSKGSDKTITVCASLLPHADVLENCVSKILADQGYELEVTVLDWKIQNDAVANKDYDANYFQHIPYLETYTGDVELFATCKVHYEPLGIYKGKGSDLLSGKSFEICNDTSNAIRAFQLLQEKGVLSTIPVNEAGDELTFEGSSWTSDNGVSVSLIEEELLVSSIDDYDFACLPCNTAYTGNVSAEKQVAKEDNAELVAAKANVLAARKDDYNNDKSYKAKIDALTDALLSEEVATYFYNAYNGAMTCDSSSQIDLR